MDYPYNQDTRRERETYIDTWYEQEKTSERIGAILLLFASALILVLERLSVADVEYKTLALAVAVGFLSGGITLLMRSRRPREERRALHFLRAENQNRNANIMGVGAAFLFMQANGKPLFMIGAALMLILSFWLRWRGYKIQRFDALFAKPIEGNNE